MIRVLKCVNKSKYSEDDLYLNEDGTLSRYICKVYTKNGSEHLFRKVKSINIIGLLTMLKSQDYIYSDFERELVISILKSAENSIHLKVEHLENMSRQSGTTFRRIRETEEVVSLLNSISIDELSKRISEVESKLRNKKVFGEV